MNTTIKKTALLVAAAPLFLAACGGSSDGPAPTPSPNPAPAGGPTPPAAPAPAPLGLPPVPTLPPAVVPAGANTFECRNVSIGAINIDAVVVPANATCVLSGTGLNGSLQVGQGASVDARNVRVTGGLQASEAAQVVVGGNSTFGAAVQISQGQRAYVYNAQITGDLQVRAQRGEVVLRDNRVGGSIQIDENLGGVQVITNRATGNLQCGQNIPPPQGSGNVAALKENQCRTL